MNTQTMSLDEFFKWIEDNNIPMWPKSIDDVTRWSASTEFHTRSQPTLKESADMSATQPDQSSEASRTKYILAELKLANIENKINEIETDLKKEKSKQFAKYSEQLEKIKAEFVKIKSKFQTTNPHHQKGN